MRVAKRQSMILQIPFLIISALDLNLVLFLIFHKENRRSTSKDYKNIALEFVLNMQLLNH